MVHVVGGKIGMRMEVLFPLVRNLSTKGMLDFLSRFHDPTWLLQNLLFRFSPTDSRLIVDKTSLPVYPFSAVEAFKHISIYFLSSPTNLREMATTSGAVLNGLGSSFLRGGNRSQTLLSAAGVGARATGPKRFIVVAAAQPKKSWIPGVRGGGNFIDPEWLDGSLPGDYGFDPLGLGKDPAFLKWYREAELIHGRWAMTAVVGIFVGQAWSGIPWFEAGADPGAIAPFSFGSLLGTQLILMGWVESKRWVDFFNPDSQSVEWATPWSRTAENFANATGDQGYPGGKFFDPLGFAGTLKDGVYIPDFEKLERLKLAEIKHARLAMVAMLIFYFEAGQGKTPLGALGL